MRMAVALITTKINVARHSVLYTQLANSPMVWLVLIYPRPYCSKYLIHKFSQSLTTAVSYDRKPKSRLESLQTTFLKHALRVRVQTSNLATLGESGRYPLIARQEKQTLGYLLKLTTVPTPNPLRIVYAELYRLSMAGQTTWCSHVRELLKSKLSDIWEDQKILVSVERINQLKSLFKVELECYYTRNCLKYINNAEKHPILRTYTVFREKFCLETYTQCMPIKNINKLYPVSEAVPTDYILNWVDIKNRIFV